MIETNKSDLIDHRTDWYGSLWIPRTRHRPPWPRTNPEKTETQKWPTPTWPTHDQTWPQRPDIKLGVGQLSAFFSASRQMASACRLLCFVLLRLWSYPSVRLLREASKSVGSRGGPSFETECWCSLSFDETSQTIAKQSLNRSAMSS